MTAVDGAGHTAAVAVRRRGALALDGSTRDLVLVAAVAMPLALWNPVVASVASLAAFGLAHTVLELRWVLARFKAFFTTPFLAALVALATTIAIVRLTGGPKDIEIIAGFGLVALALTRGRLGAPATAAAAIALAVGLAAALHTPALYGVVLAHLHNTVTGLLLWEWSGDMADDTARRRFRTGLVLVFAAVPAIVLLGAADAAIPHHLAATGPTGMLLKGTTPAAWLASEAATRLVAVFAFLQLVHYGVWCWLLPRRDPAPPLPAATKTWPAIVIATALLAFVFATDYATGRTLYTTVATYHAYLELPVVLVLLGGSRAVR